MKKCFISSLVALFFLSFISCETTINSSKNNELTSIEKKSIVKNLNADEFNSALKTSTNSILIDVRTAEEIAETGIIAGAKNLDINASSFANDIAALEKTKTIFVYCRSGRRSAAAAEQLQTLGFGPIYNLDGGILAWQEKGLPLNK